MIIMNIDQTSSPTIQQAVDSFFEDFDFGEGSERTRLAYRTGARAFLRFIEKHDSLAPEMLSSEIRSSISTEFNAWMQSAEHTGPGLTAGEDPARKQQGYSVSTRRLYIQALNRMLGFWGYHGWLTFSPEEEDQARKLLQIQRSEQKKKRAQTRSDAVPTDFGDRMLETALALPLPTEREISNPRERRKARLATLRARALVAALRTTALRAGDLVSLERDKYYLAKDSGGYIRVEMEKTQKAAHVFISDSDIEMIDAYLEERHDSSPFLFVQHGASGRPARGRDLSPGEYRRRQRGYGAKVSPGLVRSIVVGLARRAGYQPGKEKFVSTHAFRHWHAQRLIDAGASIDQVQSLLGHARSETTSDVYAPEPNIANLAKLETETFG